MLTSIHGIYRNGKIILPNLPDHVREETPVIVTFMEPSGLDLQARGIHEPQAAYLRTRLATFAEDWENPEMDVYDNYDAAKTNL